MIFIELLSEVAHPIASLQRKNVKFLWFDKCEKRFQCLKVLLTNSPIFKIADIGKYCIVCNDACIKRLGGVIM